MTENMYATNNADFEYLREQGFTEDEAANIISMKNHFGERSEYQELLAEQKRQQSYLAFIRWLVQHDRLKEDQES